MYVTWGWMFATVGGPISYMASTILQYSPLNVHVKQKLYKKLYRCNYFNSLVTS